MSDKKTVQVQGLGDFGKEVADQLAENYEKVHNKIKELAERRLTKEEVLIELNSIKTELGLDETAKVVAETLDKLYAKIPQAIPDFIKEKTNAPNPKENFKKLEGIAELLVKVPEALLNKGFIKSQTGYQVKLTDPVRDETRKDENGRALIVGYTKIVIEHAETPEN